MTLVGVLRTCALGLVMSACTQTGASDLQDLATASSMKTGMFLPQPEASSGRASSGKALSSEVLAKKLNVTLNADDTYRVTRTVEGEQVLFVERKGMLPVPLASIDGKGKKFQWSFFVFKSGDGKVLSSKVYIRHPLGERAYPYVTKDGRQSNLFVFRSAYASQGVLEPMLVSWLSHLVTPDGSVFYRVGNTILDSKGNEPVMAFHAIAENVWRMTGFYRDDYVVPGTVFWTEDGDTYYSLAPKTKKLTSWKKQDDNSMDVVGPADVTIPKAVAKAVAFGESKGYGDTAKIIPVAGFKRADTDRRTIPVYGVRATEKSGLALTERVSEEELRRVGAFSDERELGFSLYSGSGGRPGEVVQVQNWNNGGWFNKARVVSNEPHLVARGSVNGWWTGKSDYQGHKAIYEILDRDGEPTGQFIEQTYNEGAEVFDQRMLSRSELTSEAQATLAAKDDEMRAINAQIAETTATANDQGARADALAEEAFTRAKALPGNATAAAANAALGDKLKVGGPDITNQAAAWAAQGAGKETLAQGINVGVDRATGGWAGEESMDGGDIFASGVGSMLGKSAGDGLSSELGKAGEKVIEKGVGGAGTRFGDVVGDAVEGETNTVQGGDAIALGVADTVVDSGFAAAGSTFGPGGRAVAAVGAEITKVGNAEVGALGLTAAEMSTRSELNEQQTSALNTLSGARESEDVLEYLEAPPAEPSYDTSTSIDTSSTLGASVDTSAYALIP